MRSMICLIRPMLSGLAETISVLLRSSGITVTFSCATAARCAARQIGLAVLHGIADNFCQVIGRSIPKLYHFDRHQLHSDLIDAVDVIGDELHAFGRAGDEDAVGARVGRYDGGVG